MVDDAISEIEAELAGGIMSRGQASALAMDLFLLADVAGLSREPRVVSLCGRLGDAIRLAGYDDLASTQAGYAIRLASAPGALLYEEMHKLFSLAGEVHALERLGLGLGLSEAIARELKEVLRARFSAQSREARMVAEDKAEDWNRGLWWFFENLTTGRA